MSTHSDHDSDPHDHEHRSRLNSHGADATSVAESRLGKAVFQSPRLEAILRDQIERQAILASKASLLQPGKVRPLQNSQAVGLAGVLDEAASCRPGVPAGKQPCAR